MYLKAETLHTLRSPSEPGCQCQHAHQPPFHVDQTLQRTNTGQYYTWGATHWRSWYSTYGRLLGPTWTKSWLLKVIVGARANAGMRYEYPPSAKWKWKFDEPIILDELHTAICWYDMRISVLYWQYLASKVHQWRRKHIMTGPARPRTRNYVWTLR